MVDMANASGDESDEGKPYLLALVAASGILFAGSLAAIGAMFYYFDGCAENELVVSLTLILAVVSICTVESAVGLFVEPFVKPSSRMRCCGMRSEEMKRK